MFTRPVALFAAFMLFFASTLAGAAPKKEKDATLSVPVAGSFSDPIRGAGVFNGTFKLVEFVAEGTQLVANGTLIGTLTSASGMPIGTVMKSVSIPVKASTEAAARAIVIQAVCPILSLDLGPLNLDLLGLVVDLSPIALDITAVSGPGNLLGNLLCAVVGLLDGVGGAGPLAQIADLLNQILAILSGLLG